MEQFAIGEVAILQNCALAAHEGLEVVVTSKQREIKGAIRVNGEVWSGIGYSIDGPDGINCAMARQLRKKRPPTTDEAECRQAMLDCIERAKRGQEIEA